jgi:cobalt/nickel transport system permease protein
MLLDRYVPGTSPLHRLDARVKLVLAVSYIVCAALLPVGAWLALLCLTALVWLAIIVSGVGLRAILKRTLLGLPFLLIAVTVIFSVPGEPVLRIPLGFARLTVTDAGLLRFATIVWKSWLSLQVALLLSATTHFLNMLHALRALRLPSILVAILSLMYRYLFVLADEAQRLQRARVCRSAAFDGTGGGTLLWRARVTGRMVGTLLLRAFERSERIYLAMLARGYTGELRTLEQPALPRRDGLVGLMVAVLLVLIVLQAYVGRGL